MSIETEGQLKVVVFLQKHKRVKKEQKETRMVKLEILGRIANDKL